ncbi:hypothetical protein [Pseudomonas syringae pv. coryli]|uniref:hypothetical protein n=1 Tax=Pseudomonas syringae pv. coryli TaxID=317659 RepID=UPI003D29DD9F
MKEYRAPFIWLVVGVLFFFAFYYALRAYTADLDRPSAFIRFMLLAHLLRLYYSVKHDLTLHAPKELALLNFAATIAVLIAMGVRPWVINSIHDMETDAEIQALEAQYTEYAVVIHSKLFGITAFFLAAYYLVLKLVIAVGRKWRLFAYPRSSFECFGAFYEAANRQLPRSQMEQIERQAKANLANHKGVYPVPTAKYLL